MATNGYTLGSDLAPTTFGAIKKKPTPAPTAAAPYPVGVQPGPGPTPIPQTLTQPTAATAPATLVGGGSKSDGMPWAPGTGPISAGPGPTPIPQPIPGVTTGPGPTPITTGWNGVPAGGTGAPNPGAPLGAIPRPNGYVTPFGPGNDLIGQQINPLADPRLQRTQGAVDSAVNALTGGPDRAQLASQYVDLWNRSTQPQYEADLRKATQLAAANGRLGSGMLTTDYGNITNARANARDVATQGFLTDALSGTIQDRLNNVGALSGLESQQFGQGAQQRNELRGERTYQQGLDQQSLQNEIQRQQLQDYLLNAQFGRDQSQLNTLLNYGFGGQNPAGAYLNASGQQAAGAAGSNQAIYDLLSQYFLGRGG